jgi:hypothetical protein
MVLTPANVKGSYHRTYDFDPFLVVGFTAGDQGQVLGGAPCAHTLGAPR